MSSQKGLQDRTGQIAQRQIKVVQTGSRLDQHQILVGSPDPLENVVVKVRPTLESLEPWATLAEIGRKLDDGTFEEWVEIQGLETGTESNQLWKPWTGFGPKAAEPQNGEILQRPALVKAATEPVRQVKFQLPQEWSAAKHHGKIDVVVAPVLQVEESELGQCCQCWENQ